MNRVELGLNRDREKKSWEGMLSRYLGVFEQLGVRCSNSSCRTTLAAVVRAFPWWLEHHL